MKLVVEALNETNVADLNRMDREFVIDGRIILHLENNQFHYTAVPQPPTKKRYPEPDIDITACLGNPDQAIYLAYGNGRLAGQIILRKNWNNYAYIEDIVVDANFRRLGVGQALIDRAKEWAGQQGLPGLMLETQDNNVAACKLYEACGFEIGGFDKFLYKGLDADRDETAIFWYFHFPTATMQLEK